MSKVEHMENKGSILDKLIGRISPAELKKTRDRMNLSATISDLLAERNMSKSQFAKFMGKEPSVITKWLSGTHNFTIDTLSEISECLGFPLAKFFEEKEPEIIYRSHFAITGNRSDLHNRINDVLNNPAILDKCSNKWVSEFQNHIIFYHCDEEENWNTASVLDFKTERHAVSTEKISHPRQPQKI